MRKRRTVKRGGRKSKKHFLPIRKELLKLLVPIMDPLPQPPPPQTPPPENDDEIIFNDITSNNLYGDSNFRANSTFSEREMDRLRFFNCKFDDTVVIKDSMFQNCMFFRCDFNGCVFHNAKFLNSQFINCLFEKTEFKCDDNFNLARNIDEINVISPDEDYVIRSAKLTFGACIFSNCDFINVKMYNQLFSGTTIENVSFIKQNARNVVGFNMNMFSACTIENVELKTDVGTNIIKRGNVTNLEVYENMIDNIMFFPEDHHNVQSRNQSPMVVINFATFLRTRNSPARRNSQSPPRTRRRRSRSPQ